MKVPHIIVFTGSGSSNSWIWLVDFLEKFGYSNTLFCYAPKEILNRSKADILIVPGGDTFRIAESFGYKGLERLSAIIAGGVGYIGICAGAYLPLRSSLSPLSSFNIVNMKIANIAPEIPVGINDIERYTVKYGCSLIFHPVRGPVLLSGEKELIAPLYGGPILKPFGEEIAKLSFKDLTQDSEILIERRTCKNILAGNIACSESWHEKGRVLLISPHLEHPDFPEANKYLANLIDNFKINNSIKDELNISNCENGGNIRSLRRIIADLRLLANRIESQTWKVGIKYWEGEKILFFIEAVRKRIITIQRNHWENRISIPPIIIHAFELAKDSLRKYQNGFHNDEFMQNLVNNLSTGTSQFMNSYFRVIAERSANFEE